MCSLFTGNAFWVFFPLFPDLLEVVSYMSSEMYLLLACSLFGCISYIHTNLGKTVSFCLKRWYLQLWEVRRGYRNPMTAHSLGLKVKKVQTYILKLTRFRSVIYPRDGMPLFPVFPSIFGPPHLSSSSSEIKLIPFPRRWDKERTLYLLALCHFVNLFFFVSFFYC